MTAPVQPFCRPQDYHSSLTMQCQQGTLAQCGLADKQPRHIWRIIYQCQVIFLLSCLPVLCWALRNVPSRDVAFAAGAVNRQHYKAVKATRRQITVSWTTPIHPRVPTERRSCRRHTYLENGRRTSDQSSITPFLTEPREHTGAGGLSKWERVDWLFAGSAYNNNK